MRRADRAFQVELGRREQNTRRQLGLGLCFWYLFGRIRDRTGAARLGMRQRIEGNETGCVPHAHAPFLTANDNGSPRFPRPKPQTARLPLPRVHCCDTRPAIRMSPVVVFRPELDLSQRIARREQLSVRPERDAQNVVDMPMQRGELLVPDDKVRRVPELELEEQHAVAVCGRQDCRVERVEFRGPASARAARGVHDGALADPLVGDGCRFDAPELDRPVDCGRRESQRRI
eukprot:3885429-Rhodomonas_salina.2